MSNLLNRFTSMFLSAAVLTAALPVADIADLKQPKAAKAESGYADSVPSHSGTKSEVQLDHLEFVEEKTPETPKPAKHEPAPSAPAEPAPEPEVSLMSVTEGDYTYYITEAGEASITKYTGSSKILVVPDTLGGCPVTRIGSNSFANHKWLERITLPDSVTDISWGAFEGCINLSYFHYPLNWKTADYYQYYNSSVFKGCTSLTSIIVPEGITKVPDNAFWDAPALTNVSLPQSLTEIGQYAFHHCPKLSTVNFPPQLKTIGKYAFEGDALTAAPLPDTVSSIGERAFYQCSNLASLHYPMNWKTAGERAFAECPKLTSVVIPEGITETPANAFSGASSLPSVSFPSSLTRIGSSSFGGCTGLKSVIIPHTRVESVSTQAFVGCSALTTVRLPDSVTDIGWGAFQNCTGLSSFHYPLNWKTARYYDYYHTSVFQDCNSLTSITVPEGVTRIPDDAFRTAPALAHVSLPQSLAEIGDGAFSGCSKLKLVDLLSSQTTFTENTFANSPNVALRCIPASLSGSHAIKYTVPMIDNGMTADRTNAQLDYDVSYYQINGESISAAGTFDMVAQYAFKPSADVSDVFFEFYVPDTATVPPGAVAVDNQLFTDATVTDGILRVPVSQTSGTIRFRMKPITSSKPYYTYAMMSCTQGGKAYREVISCIYLDIPALTLDMDNITNSSDFTVHGYAAPGSQVSLYVDQAMQATVTANKPGHYTARLKLSAPVNGKCYLVRAESVKDPALTSERYISYHPDTANMLYYTLEHNGACHTFYPDSSVSPRVTFRPGSPFTFKIYFDHPESVGGVSIVSNRNGILRFMTPKWDETQGAFVVTGFFDPNNTAYVPGILSVEYVSKRDKISFTDTPQFDAEEIRNSLPPELSNSHFDVLVDTENEQTIKVESATRLYTFEYHYESKKIPSEVTPQTIVSSGYTSAIDDFGNQVYTKVSQFADGIGYLFVDFGKDQLQSIFFESIDVDEIADVAEGLDSLDVMQKYDQLRKDIVADTRLNQDQKDFYLGQITQAQIAHSGASVIKLLFGFNPPKGGPKGLGLLFGFMGWNADMLQDYYEILIDDLMRDMRRSTRRVSFAIDPSGYVYDTEDQSRLAGVTATVYWIPFDENDPDYWNKKPAEDQYGEKWDASEFSQSNPLITDGDGRYAWDVPEDWWRVKYEKADYLTTRSEWLPVPPPQTEVNVGMTRAFRYASSGVGQTGTTVSLTSSGEFAQVQLVIAAYDKDGRMVAQNSQTTALTAQQTLDLTVNYTAEDAVTDVRLFILDTEANAPIGSGWSAASAA